MYLCEVGGWSYPGEACSASVVGLGRLLCWKAGQAERIKLLQAELSRAHKPLCLTKDQKPGLRKLLGAELELQRTGSHPVVVDKSEPV